MYIFMYIYIYKTVVQKIGSKTSGRNKSQQGESVNANAPSCFTSAPPGMCQRCCGETRLPPGSQMGLASAMEATFPRPLEPRVCLKMGYPKISQLRWVIMFPFQWFRYTKSWPRLSFPAAHGQWGDSPPRKDQISPDSPEWQAPPRAPEWQKFHLPFIFDNQDIAFISKNVKSIKSQLSTKNCR